MQLQAAQVSDAESRVNGEVVLGLGACQSSLSHVINNELLELDIL